MGLSCPVVAFAVETDCQVINNILQCNSYKTPQDQMQDEADKWNNTDWNSKIIKPITPAIPSLPLFPIGNGAVSNSTSSSSTLSPSDFNSSLQKGVENLYSKLNQLQPPAPKPTPTPSLRSIPRVNSGNGGGLEKLLTGEQVAPTLQPDNPPKIQEQQSPGFFKRIANFFHNLF